MKSETFNKEPAHVRFTKDNADYKNFTAGAIYEAFFVEYWQGIRNSLHVKNDFGRIVDFIPLEDFEIIDDKDNVLNNYEARVRCITHDFEDMLLGINYGKEYIAIGRDRNGMYLVMDESYDCYFYDASCFEILDDSKGILTEESMYYSYE